MEPITALALLLGSVVAILTSLAYLWVKVIKPGWRVMRRLGEVVDVVVDLPEWQKGVDKSLKELNPNGGGSIKDEVSHIKEMMQDHLKNH